MNRGTASLTHRRHQCGAVTVYVVAAIAALLTAAFTVFEVGRIYLYNRHLQKMASLAALDAVREASGCDRDLGLSPAQIRDLIVARVNESLNRNDGNGVDVSQIVIDVDTGTVQSVSVNGQLRRSLTETRDGGIIPVDEADAVRVTLTGPFPGLLTGLLRRDDGSSMMQVSATAEQPVQGIFQVGSGLISLNGGALNAVLSALLGGSVTLNALDYQNGLAKVNITVEQLATALDLSVQDLSNPLVLQTHTPLLSNTLDGLAAALAGTVSSTVPAILRSLADDALNTRGIPLDEIIGSIGTTAPDTPLINLLDLIMALAQAANADPTGALAPIKLNFGASIAGVTLNTFLKVLEPAQIGIGRPGEAEARTAQVRLMIRLDGGPLLASLTTTISNTINSALGLLHLIGLNSSISIAPQGLKIGIDVEAVQGAAYLDRVQCPRSGVNNGEPIATLSAKTGLATVGVGTFSGNGASAPSLISGSTFPLASVDVDARNLCPLLGICLIKINLGRATLATGLGLTTLGVSQTGPNPLLLDVMQFTKLQGSGAPLPPVYLAEGIPPAPAVTGNPQFAAPTKTSVNLNLGLTTIPGGTGLLGGLSGLIGNVISSITTAVQGLLSVVNTLAMTLIDPLLGALGIQTGTGTVIMQSVTVNQPVIVSTLRPFEINANP